jgi:hypothetical protein
MLLTLCRLLGITAELIRSSFAVAASNSSVEAGLGRFWSALRRELVDRLPGIMVQSVGSGGELVFWYKVDK